MSEMNSERPSSIFGTFLVSSNYLMSLFYEDLLGREKINLHSCLKNWIFFIPSQCFVDSFIIKESLC